MNSSNTTTGEQETENNKTEIEHNSEEKVTLFINKRKPDVILEKCKKKNNIKLIPPKETDQPKPLKRKYTKPKLKIENDQKRKKISSMFKPKLPYRILDNETSTLNIYTEDNNFEDDLTLEDNPTTISGLRKGVCSPQPLAEQDLTGSNDVLEDSKYQIFSNQQQPDLAIKRLPFLPDNSNQQITGESG